jgi:hypothetical protein
MRTQMEKMAARAGYDLERFKVRGDKAGHE